jgi:endonuclease YncB( thermonuclease family)
MEAKPHTAQHAMTLETRPNPSFTGRRYKHAVSFNKPFRAIPIQIGKHYRVKRRRARFRRAAMPVAILGAAAVVGGIAGIMQASTLSFLMPGYDDTVSGCTVTDGDTIRCNSERIRLLGIDAPELPGHCRKGRACVAGDPYASTQSLADALAGTIHISRAGQDRYGRTLATLFSDKGNLSCWQLKHGQAVYKARWDNGGRVIRTCPGAALL